MRPIKIYNPHLTTFKPLVAAVRFKDLIVTEGDGLALFTDEVVLEDKILRVRGLNASIQYLDEKYPHPPFFPIEPEKRAVMRMIIDDIVSTNCDYRTYESNLPEQFFAGPNLSILDIFLDELAPQSKLWDDYRNRIRTARR